ncbi:MAG: MBL fold metallo-hydrolase [Nitrospinae bacterium]|nr:MBL fold metallo-hydrolase [Nitrospinota bacterium]
MYIEAGQKRILIDAGLSEKKLSARMTQIDRSFSGMDAVFATHEHSDHIRGIGPLLRKHEIPLYATEGTWRRANHTIGKINDFKTIRENEPVHFEELSVEPYSTPHDAEESVAFVIRYQGKSLGIATDLGRVTPEVKNKLKNLDALLVEANHDISMLEAGPYPWMTKKRIKSGVGHLSNESCGELLASVTHFNLKRVVLMHMSETNNHPELAKITARQALGETSSEMTLAQQNHPTELFSI